MADSDDLYARMNADDDLSTALGTETLADRDMVPARVRKYCYLVVSASRYPAGRGI